MEFPRHLHKDNGQFVVVKDSEQYDACKGAGWADAPDAHVEQPVEVRYADAINGAVIDFDADEPKSDDAPKRKKRAH